MHRVLALTILEQRMRSSKLQQRFYYEWVSAQYRLVQWKFVAAIDTGFSFFHKEVEDVEVEVAASREKFEKGTFLIDQNVDVVVLLVDQLPHSFVV
jgi:hypothetical protein